MHASVGDGAASGKAVLGSADKGRFLLMTMRFGLFWCRAIGCFRARLGRLQQRPQGSQNCQRREARKKWLSHHVKSFVTRISSRVIDTNDNETVKSDLRMNEFTCLSPTDEAHFLRGKGAVGRCVDAFARQLPPGT